MALSTDVQTLTGKDGAIYKGEIGTEVPGDDTTPLGVGYHLITAVAGTTGFPTNSGATGAVDVKVGYVIRVQAGETITPATGDATKPITLTEWVDVTSWNIEFTADELEDTNYFTDQKTYAVGKTDFSGSLEGRVTLNETDLPGGTLARFIDVVQQDGITSIDLFEKGEDLIIANLVSNKTTAKGDRLEFFGAVNIFGSGIGGSQSDLQTFSSSMRLKSGSEITPVLLRSVNA